jgi:hypothetical protein
MVPDTGLDRSHRDVQFLLGRTAILDRIAGHGRGCERHDVDLIAAACHDGRGSG